MGRERPNLFGERLDRVFDECLDVQDDGKLGTVVILVLAKVGVIDLLEGLELGGGRGKLVEVAR